MEEYEERERDENRRVPTERMTKQKRKWRERSYRIID